MLTAEWLHLVQYFSTEYHNSHNSVRKYICRWYFGSEALLNTFWEYSTYIEKCVNCAIKFYWDNVTRKGFLLSTWYKRAMSWWGGAEGGVAPLATSQSIMWKVFTLLYSWLLEYHLCHSNDLKSHDGEDILKVYKIQLLQEKYKVSADFHYNTS